jgi:hypothetical protein
MGADEAVRNRFFRKVHGKTAVFFRVLFFGTNNKMRKYTFLVLLFFGLAGVLIDLDHFIIQQTQMVRPLHLPYWFGVWIVGICYYAYIHRRVHNFRVREVKQNGT